MRRLVIDPAVRVKGHLRVELELEGKRVKGAYLSGTMVRGIELILEGRDPREAWAFAQRICGVCDVAQALASLRAVENALRIPVPRNASLMRKLMLGTLIVKNHVTHFYHMCIPDWVSVPSALKANPEDTSELSKRVSNYEKSSPSYFREIQERLRRLASKENLVDHPDLRLPPEANLLLLAHYVEALNWRSQVVQVHTILGGKSPHPNLVVGGMPLPVDLSSGTAINMEKLGRLKSLIDNMISFVEKVYVPDLMLLSSFYRDWFEVGEGLGNFLVLGEPVGENHSEGKFFIPPAFISGRRVEEPEPVDYSKIEEYIAHSWYSYSAEGKEALNPFEGETRLSYTGPKPPYEHLNVEGKYSWVKAPRYGGLPAEVGPLARTLVLYSVDLHGMRDIVNIHLSKLNLPFQALYSTMGRNLSRGLESLLYVHAMKGWYGELLGNVRAGDTRTFEGKRWEPSSWPREASGLGVVEAPGGSLSHWVRIRHGKVSRYQVVDASAWNCSPRDAMKQPSPCEASLLDHELISLEEPIEVLRTLHSFDPCLNCAVHLYEAYI
jgi:hydrogenase large subunit